MAFKVVKFVLALCMIGIIGLTGYAYVGPFLAPQAFKAPIQEQSFVITIEAQ